MEKIDRIYCQNQTIFIPNILQNTVEYFKSASNKPIVRLRLSPKSLGCMYTCMYVWVYVYLNVCMYVNTYYMYCIQVNFTVGSLGDWRGNGVVLMTRDNKVDNYVTRLGWNIKWYFMSEVEARFASFLNNSYDAINQGKTCGKWSKFPNWYQAERYTAERGFCTSGFLLPVLYTAECGFGTSICFSAAGCFGQTKKSLNNAQFRLFSRNCQ